MSHLSASEAYAAAAGTGSGLETGSQPHSFPQFPGENALKHVADKWIQTCETRLGGMGLLSVARGGKTPESLELRDTPQLPALPPGDSGYQRRVEAIHRIAASNAEKAERRYVLEMRAWNKLYGLVLSSVEGVSTLLAQELRTLCAITEGGEDGSNFDGPLAWRVVLMLLTKAERTKEDKKYYKTAEELQLRHHLPDGCPAEDYSKKAHAYVANILPNLAQSYTPEDAGDYIIDLMPRGLRESGRRIRERLIAEGRLTDLVHVVRVCRSLVAEEQTTSKAIPTLVATAEIDVFNIMALAETTGMQLNGGNLGHGTPGLVGDSIKWCKGCPHPKGKCFMDPSFAGPLPVSVHQNEARRGGVEAGRKANATAHNVPLVRLKPPSKETIARYKANKEKDGKKRGDAAAGTKEGAAGLVGADAETLDSFMASIADLDASAMVVLTTSSGTGSTRVHPPPPAASEAMADLNLDSPIRHWPTPAGYTHHMWAMRIDDAAFTIQFFWRQHKGISAATSGAPAPAPTIMLPACCGSESSNSSPELVIADGSADEFVSFPGGTEASGNDLEAEDDGCMDCGMSWFVRFVPGSGNASVHCVADVGHIEHSASDIIVPFGENEAAARASATAMSAAQAHAPSQAPAPVAPASPSDFSGYLPFVGSPEAPNAPSGATLRARMASHTPQFGLPLKSLAETPAKAAERPSAAASGRTPRAAILSDPSLARSKLPMRGADVMAHDMATISASRPADAQLLQDAAPPTDAGASPRGSADAAVAPSGGGHKLEQAATNISKALAALAGSVAARLEQQPTAPVDTPESADGRVPVPPNSDKPSPKPDTPPVDDADGPFQRFGIQMGPFAAIVNGPLTIQSGLLAVMACYTLCATVGIVVRLVLTTIVPLVILVALGAAGFAVAKRHGLGDILISSAKRVCRDPFLTATVVGLATVVWLLAAVGVREVALVGGATSATCSYRAHQGGFGRLADAFTGAIRLVADHHLLFMVVLLFGMLVEALARLEFQLVHHLPTSPSAPSSRHWAGSATSVPTTSRRNRPASST